MNGDQTSVTGTAVQEIAALARQGAVVQEFTKGSYAYTDRPLHRVNVEPQRPEPLVFFTLAAFAAYLKAENDAPRPLVHVVKPTEVVAISPLLGSDKHLRRHTATAECTPGMEGFQFGEEYDLDQVAVVLQTCFALTPDLAALRKFCAAVRATSSIGVDDDGVSQTVEAKRGIAAVQATGVKNPWVLAPWRTFAEVDQPTSPFVLRFSGREGSLPRAALYETGNDTWSVAAVVAIASALRDLLGPEWQVLG